MAVIERVSVAKTLFIFVVSLFWSTFVGIRLLWAIVKRGPSDFLKVEKRDIRPDELDDKTYGEHHFARLKKIRLHYVANGKGGKPLMLFIHGFPEIWYSWRHQLKAFGADYRAVAIDMRGYGESEKPHGVRNYTLDKLVNDIKELIPALGYRKCILVGHDWGGMVSWAFAHMHPEMVDRVIVCNCPCQQAFMDNVTSNIQQFRKSWYVYFFQMPWLPEILMRSDDLKSIERIRHYVKHLTEDDVETYKYTFQPYGALTGPVNFYRAAFQYEPMLVYPTKKIQVPSLMIWGTNDHALVKELAEATGNYVEKYTVQYIEGATHWVPQEKPEEVNNLITEFLTDEKMELH